MPKLVFIVGGTGTIGSSLVRHFATCGATTHFSYNASREAASLLADETGAIPHQIDLSRQFRAPSLDVDVLVYNAGVNLSGHGLSEVSESELQRTIEVNCLSMVRLSQLYVPNMKAQGRGRIISINSIFGLTAPALRLSYAISKFGLRAATRSLAQELAPFGITVNDVCPGPVLSEMLIEMARVAVENGRFTSSEEYLASVRAEVPIGRFIEPSDVVGVVDFLAGDAAAACTGLAVQVDGGMLNY